jgi:hypothetical protein
LVSFLHFHWHIVFRREEAMFVVWYKLFKKLIFKKSRKRCVEKPTNKKCSHNNHNPCTSNFSPGCFYSKPRNSESWVFPVLDSDILP